MILDSIDLKPDQEPRKAARVLRWFFRFLPSFSLVTGVITAQFLLIQFKANPPERRQDDWWTKCDERHAEYGAQEWECARTLWDWDACGGDAFMLVMTFVGYLVLIIVWDKLMQ